jgi:Transcriptional regulator, AbiEi antitoxin, Type IV TA system
MKMAESEQQVPQALRKCLKDIPFLEIVQIQPVLTSYQELELLAPIKLSNKNWDLAILFNNSGQPRQVHQAINKLKIYSQNDSEIYPIFMTSYISSKVAEICTLAGVGYLDLAGNCRLSFGQVYIQKQINPNPVSQKCDLRSLYSPKAERILRVLLSKPDKAWKQLELASEAGVSLGQVHNVKKLLANREWLRAETEGIVLSEPASLLAEWAENYDYRRHQVHDFYSLKPIADLEYLLAETCTSAQINYAFTGFSGAARIAPFVRYQRATAYVDNNLEKITSSLQLKSVTSGANLSLLIPYDEGVFYQYQNIDNIKTVTPIQLYLDLKGYRGRGEEAAQTLLKEVWKPQW